ncbi:MAG: hypothetical protein EXS17_06710 [Phycisphaerales bacterium]|nr:hypothetical protein [Phycisphaerales bacterium]
MLIASLTAVALAIMIHPVDDAQVLAPPTAPLDSRIAKEKVTEQDLPQMPTAIVQPLPAVHRIAPSAAAVPCSEKTYADARLAIDLALTRLRATQDVSGGWMVKKAAAGTDQQQPSMAASTAVSAIALKAFAQAGATPSSDAAAAKAATLIRQRVRGGDGFFNPDPNGGLGNYVASAVVSGLAAVDDASDRPLIEEAINWLTKTQWDQSEGVSARMDWFGGSGYGKWGRPDLSNTQMMLDALHDAQVSADDPAVQRALVFLTRTQNLPATNAVPWVEAGSKDGGFVYTPANGGESFASDAAGEGRYGEKMPAGQPRSLRSYGSMTYAGFKSLLYAGLTKDDPRVQAAFNWIRRHWTFNENPGLGQQGYFYFIHAMSRALLASGQDQVIDGKGTSHAWRDELVATLIARQRSDGSWVNEASRWEEGDADLCTAYCVLALEEAIKSTKAAP